MRITFETIVTGHLEGLEKEVKSFLKSRGIVCLILTAYHPDENETKLTHIKMDGKSVTLFVVKEALDAHLKQLYPGIEIDEWVEKLSERPITDIYYVPVCGFKTKPGNDYKKTDYQKIWKDVVMSRSSMFAENFQDLEDGISELSSATSWYPKAITVSYKGINQLVNASTFDSWTSFVALLKEDGILPIEKEREIERVYHLKDSKKIFVNDVALLRRRVYYYIEEFVERKKKVVDLEGFYERLKTEQDLDEDNIQIIKNAFDAEGVKFIDLMEAGEKALTREKLKEYGIKQAGLRIAILVVISDLKNEQNL